MRRFILITFYFLQLTVQAQFSKFELKQITQEHGLPGVTVRQIFQDSKGIIWLGVESYGLCRYDGYNFELYAHNSDDSLSISNNVVEAICEDKHGNIWLGTQNGLNIFNRSTKKFQRITSKNSTIPHNLILDLTSLGNGDIWIGTGNGAVLFSSSDSTFRPILHNRSQNTAVHDILIDKQDNTWFATSTGIYTSIPNLQKIYVGEYQEFFTIEAISDSAVLIGTESDLLYLNTRTGAAKKIQSLSTEITDILKDSRNLIWVTTATRGIWLFSEDLKNVKHIDKDMYNIKGLKSDAVRDVFEDENNLLWFGLKFEGIQIYNHKIQLFAHYKNKNNGEKILTDDNIYTIFENIDKTILLGTRQGVTVFDPNTKSFLKNFDPQIAHKRINSFAVNDAVTNLYIGSSDGLYRATTKLKNIQRYFDGNIVTLLFDQYQQLWIGTKDGLFIRQNGKIISVNEFLGIQTELSSQSIKTLFLDSKNNIWIGTLQSGLFLYESAENKIKKFKTNSHSDKAVSGDLIRYVNEDTDGNIWITTRGQGLNRFSYEDSTFTLFTEKEGLPTNTLFGILVDDNSNLWISSYQGLCKFSHKDFKITNFTKEYGLQNDIFEPDASCKTSDGRMYIGGNNGFNVFRPEEINAPQKSSQLVITTVKVFENEVLHDIDSVVELHLRHYQNQLSFEFSLLDYTTNIGKRYCYRLSGIDRDSIHTETRHFANYTNLKPGEYLFKVNAETKDGIANTNFPEIRIYIDSPLWQKLWFQIAAFVTVVALFLFIFYSRIRMIKHQKIRLEKIVSKRTNDLSVKTEELQEQKTLLEQKSGELEQRNLELRKSNITKNTLVSVIGHDLKNQFQSIISYAALHHKKAMEHKISELSNSAAKIETAAKSVGTVLENLLSWYRTQNADIKPVYEAVDLLTIVNNISKSYALNLMEKDILLNIRIPSNTCVRSDKEMAKAIIRNIVNNAIKFTPEGGSITLETLEKNNMVTIFISDTGIGMSNEELETLFFFEGKTKRKGLGLQICKEFSKALNAELQVKSDPGTGTEFSFSLPAASMNGMQLEEQITLDSLQEKEVPEIKYQYIKNKKIVIVDDNKALLTHISDILEPYCEIYTATDGQKGLDIISKKIPDLIITDYAMPALNGIELVEKIQENPKLEHIPIIMLTAQNFDILKESAYSYGINDFIAKPFDERILLLKIQNIFMLLSTGSYTTKVESEEGYKIENNEDSLLNRLIEYIKQNIDDPTISVETIAEHFNLSRSTLHRKLKKETRKSPLDIINDIRFNKAKLMLQSQNYSISEIAWSIGLTDVQYFSRKFKEYFGETPSSYMKRSK